MPVDRSRRTEAVLARNKLAAEPVLAAVLVQGTVQLHSAVEIANFIGLRAQYASGYRTMITSETLGFQRLAVDALAIGRALAQGGGSVIIIDGGAGPGVAAELGLEGKPGLGELVSGDASFEGVVRRDTKSSAQIIAFGTWPGDGAPALSIDTLRLVFDALDETYGHVIVVAPEADAQAMLEKLDGRFDVGILVGETERATEPGFIGYEVPGLDVIRYARKGPVFAPRPAKLRDSHPGA